MDTCRTCSKKAAHPTWEATHMKGARTERFTYFQCTECGCLQIREVPSDLARYYQSNYYSFSGVSERKLFDAGVKGSLRRASASIGVSRGIHGRLLSTLFNFPQHHRWFRCAGVKKTSRILDYGCGSGSLLIRVWKEGFTGAFGADPFIPTEVRYKNGLVIRKASLPEIKEDSSIDFIMMNHSFEHIPDQSGTLLEVKRLLTPSGVAMIRLPLASSTAWERYRTDWVSMAVPEHLYLHTEKSMNILADKAGFSIKEVLYDSLGLQFWGSELVRQGIPIEAHGEAVKRFTKDELERWEEEAQKANAERKGDMACFFLKRT